MKDVALHGSELEMDLMTSTTPPEKRKVLSPETGQQQRLSPINMGVSPQIERRANGDEKNGHAKEGQSLMTGKALETQALPNGKTRTAVSKPHSKKKMSQHKEKKATQMLAIVLGRWDFLLLATLSSNLRASL